MIVRDTKLDDFFSHARDGNKCLSILKRCCVFKDNILVRDTKLDDPYARDGALRILKNTYLKKRY